MASVFFESSSELAKLTNTFKVDSVATDPTTISLIVTTPSQSSTTYTFAASEITKTSTGVYTKNITCNEDGTWTYKWVGTGAAEDTVAGTWEVLPTELGRLYCPVETLKSRFGLTDTNDDFELHRACLSTSRWVEHHCQRVFYRGATGTARKYIASDLYCLKFADTDPFAGDWVSVSAVKTDAGGDGTFETTWASSDYELGPVNAAAGPEARPYTTLEAIGSHTFPVPHGRGASRYRVEVTGVPGWAGVPWGVKMATEIISSEVFKAKDTFQAQGGFAEFGSFVMRRNPQSLDFLRDYRRYAVLVG